MVKVRDELAPTTGESFDFREWYRELELPAHTYDIDRIQRAVGLSEKLQLEAVERRGLLAENSSFSIGLQMISILREFKADEDTVVAAILYRQVRKERIAAKSIRQEFGGSVADLIAGVQRMAMISQISSDPTRSVLGQSENQALAIRKMLVSVVDDVRIALLKLVERTVAIRVAKNDLQRRSKIAREVFNVYVPLAHRLGMGQLKWELEDLSFRYLEPQVYKQIVALLAEKRVDRQDYIDKVIQLLGTSLSEVKIEAEVSGRAKHIFSIWRKMRVKKISFAELYDIRAVRILVNAPHDCYSVLGIVHMMWPSIPTEFDDYIANPKENGYRSLHTAVIGPEGRTLEVQIRTHAMHQEAEFGVCAHWLYKKSDGMRAIDASYEQKIAWLREVFEWSANMHDIGQQGRAIRNQISNDRVYVFTPEGHVVDLPAGATPIDFAYHVHTDIGHRCRGSKVDGRIVPLNYQLKTGEQVEIITGGSLAPSRDWMRKGLSYTRTARAQQKIRQWFKRLDQEENEAAGQQLLEREFKRLALTSIDYQYIARKVNCTNVESMYAALGAGDLSVSQVLNAAQALLAKDTSGSFSSPTAAPRAGSEQDARVEGVGNLISHFAGCCKPLPGDPITGYVTQGRGVSVHRQDCSRMMSLSDKDPERVIEVSWDSVEESSYPVDISVLAYDRRGLLSDVTGLLAAEKFNLTQVQTLSDKKTNTAKIVIRVEIDSLDSLSSLLAKINMLPNVSSAERIQVV